MPRYADPGLCPDCRTTLPAAPAQCPTCALPLRGPTAAALLSTLTRADELLAVLRASSPATESTVSTVSTGIPTAAPAAAAAPVPSGLRGSSVPRVLLGLGAACLLVAAVAFLAVAWSWLGVEGRTAVLLALTGSAAAAAVVLARRPLPVAAEALTTVALGLVALDVLGARSSGWLGGVGDGGATAVVGTAVGLAAAGLVAATHLRGGAAAPGAAPVAAQVGVALGLLLLGGGTVVATGHLTTTATATVLAAALLAALAHRLGLRAAADSAAVVAGTWWLGLTAAGLADAAAAPSLRGLALEGAGAGLLAAGLLALLPLAHPVVRRSRAAGPGLAAVSALLLTLLAVIPLADGPTGPLLVGCLLGLAAWTAVAAVAPAPRWRTATAAPQLVLALPAGLVALDLVGAAVGNVVRLGERAGAVGAVPLDAVLGATATAAAPALLVPAVCVLALAGAVHLPARRRTAGLVAGVAVALPATAVALAAGPVPLGLVVAVALLPGVVAAVAALADRPRGRRTALLAGSALTGGTALLLALPSAALTALVLVPVAAVAGTLALTERGGGRARTAARAVLPLAAGGLAWSLADLAGLAVADRAVPVLLVVGVLAVLRPHPVLESAAVLSAVPAVVTSLAAVAAAPATSLTGSASVALALHLTLAGALLTASAALHPSRRLLAWPGGLLLAAATWVRLADLGVTVPEAYTLPTALALVAVGLLRLRRDPGAATRTTLLPGLVLATLPSLLVVLAGDPVSPRALALGLGCLVLLLAGARLRWSAPVVVGGAAGAALVAAELAPYAAVVPQWLLLAAAGILLTAVGVTWEDRSADARRAARYLVRLR